MVRLRLLLDVAVFSPFIVQTPCPNEQGYVGFSASLMKVHCAHGSTHGPHHFVTGRPDSIMMGKAV
jgi:hypothetical protein